VFLDTETTGLDDHAEIIEIAIVDRNGTVLLDTLVRPTDLIPQDAIDIHGIEDAAVVDAPTWPEVYPLVGRILDRYSPVVIYNADFDVRVMNQVNRRHGLPEFRAEWHCAMKQYAAFAGEWHPKYDTFRWHKLTEALRRLNLRGPAISHRALSDAESCRRVVEAMAAEAAVTQPVVIPPERPGPEGEPGWTTSTRTIPGGRVTVVSSSGGCSTGLLLAILFVGTACIIVGCCAFFYVAMVMS
jgi:DNA polymerase III subunit epsilon